MLDREGRKDRILASLRAMGGPGARVKAGRKDLLPVGDRPSAGGPLPGAMPRPGDEKPRSLRVTRGTRTLQQRCALPPMRLKGPCSQEKAQQQSLTCGGATRHEEVPRCNKPEAVQRFQKAAKCVAFLCFLYKNHHLLANPNYSVQRVKRCGPDPQRNPHPEEDILFDVTKFRVAKQRRLSDCAVRILRSCPWERTEQDIRRVLAALLPVRAFGSYSAKLQKKVVRVAWYSRYESCQVMIQQGQPPHSFYICLSGSASVIKKHSKSGQVKPAWFFTQGDTFGDFLRLFLYNGRNVISDPEQIMFLRTLQFLRGWPVHLLEDHPGKCGVCHFRRGSIILRNSNATEWIYIVKSGSCSLFKVFREAPCVKNMAPLKRRKQTSIAEAAASLVKLEVWKPMLEHHNLILDKCILHSQSRASSSKQIKAAEKSKHLSNAQCLNQNHQSRQKDITALYGPSTIRRMSSTKTKRVVTPKGGNEKAKGFSIPLLKVSYEGTDINREAAPMKSAHLRPCMTTSIATEEENQKVQKSVAGSRRVAPVLITLGTLERGSVFGLSDVLFKDQSSLCVVSNGVECLKISKRFYLDHVPEEVIEKLRRHEHPYPSEKDLWDQLQKQLQWQGFRKATYRSTLQNIERTQRLLQYSCGRTILQPQWKS
ncbi:cyclic nucleotide-binding domain-containing protein 2-like isoform X2 [Ambystoma mexicanum]|uniref:cyclic nucleotide-binding domain-containing protein 2-like isoform X2 n=1 Tax=Ambystoma mexicanum TaxID=8296 RepID=UPI0037E812B0